MGNNQSNGTAEKAIQSLGEPARVVKAGLEARLGINLHGSHALTPWLIEHATALLSNYTVRPDGRTPHEWWKGKKVSHDRAYSGEKVHYKLSYHQGGDAECARGRSLL